MVEVRRTFFGRAWERTRGSLDWRVLGMVGAIKITLILFGTTAHTILTNSDYTTLRGQLLIWNQWDASHYLDLAQFGYQARGDSRFLLVFFPLFPWTVRLVAWALGDYLVSALLVSTLASFALAALFTKLVELDAPKEVASLAVWFLFIFPTSYFLHIGYTESLFLALVVGAFLAARRERWLLAGALGALASLARLNGLILLPALAVEAAHQYHGSRRLRRDWLWLGLITLGPAIYLYVNYHVTGSPITFMTIQREHWIRQLAWPWDGLRQLAHGLTYRPPAEKQMVVLQELIFTALGAAGVIGSLVKLRPSYTVWMALNWLLFTSNSFVISVPRYTLTLFPLFILLGFIGQSRVAYSLVSTWSLLFLALFTSLFVQPQWAF